MYAYILILVSAMLAVLAIPAVQVYTARKQAHQALKQARQGASYHYPMSPYTACALYAGRPVSIRIMALSTAHASQKAQQVFHPTYELLSIVPD